MPVLQKRAALGWAITKDPHGGQQRAQDVTHRQDCCGWWGGARTGGELVHTDTSVCLITSNTWSRKMTGLRKIERTSSSADNASTHCSGRIGRFVLETACSGFWPHLTSFSFGPAVTWKCNQSSTQLKHHLMCLNSSCWQHRRFKVWASEHGWLGFNTNKTPSGARFSWL